MSNKSLISIKKGENARIKKINNTKNMKDRLLDFGLTPESSTKYLFSAPSGDPLAFLVRGAVIAIRKNDCSEIEIYDEEGTGNDEN